MALLFGAVTAAATRTAFLRTASLLSPAAAVSVAASSWLVRLSAYSAATRACGAFCDATSCLSAGAASALLASTSKRSAVARVLSFTLSSAFTRSAEVAFAKFGTVSLAACLWSTRQMRP